MKMFFIICLCALLSTGTSIDNTRKAVKFPPEATAIIIAAIRKCMEETGVPPDTVDRTREGNYQEDDMFKKHVYCVYQESGYANPDGHIITSKTAELFPKELNMLPLIDSCDKQGKDPEETTYLFFKCFQDTSPVRMAL